MIHQPVGNVCRRVLPWFMLFHFCVDFCCGASVILAATEYVQRDYPVLFVALYNFLAFCTQPLTGAVCDRLQSDRSILFFSLTAVFLGGISVGTAPWPAVVLLGMGNSFFHVSAGREIIRAGGNSRNDRLSIAPLGAFVAPGALGVGIGSLLAAETYGFSLVALEIAGVLGGWCLLRIPEIPPAAGTAPQRGTLGRIPAELCAGLVIFCVFCRAAAGGCIRMPWSNNIRLSIVLFALVTAGKIAGGYLADRFSWRRTGMIALLISMMLLYFCGDSVLGALTGQFAANLMMPVTLFLLTALYPQRPGTMFGAAAAVLYPGALMKYLPNAAESFLTVNLIALGCFIAVAVLWNRREEEK